MKALPQARQLALAYQAVFEDEGPEILTSSGRQLRFEGGKIVWLNDTAVLLAPASNVGFSPATTGALGIFYLKADGQVFEVTRRFPFAVEGNLSGSPPGWSVSRDIANLPVIISVTHVVWQGATCATTTLTEIGSEAPGQLVAFRSAFSNGGSAGKRGAIQSIRGNIANVRKERSFDVRFVGTRSFTHRYVRAFDGYDRASGTAVEELPGCQM